jgi:hypothetical protein
MNKIFKYELKRLVFSKFFIVVSAITILFSFYTLNTKIIKGVGFTAPFSKWSYSGFLCEVQPFLLLILIFFTTMLFTKNEDLVKKITLATPISYTKYFAVKILSISAAYFLIAAISILISMIFYVMTFQFTNFVHFIFPTLLILLPNFVFVFGISLYLGNKKLTWLYILIPITLILSFLNFNTSPFLDIFTKGFVWHTPSTLPIGIDGDAIFKVSVSFILSRIFLIALGLLGFVHAVKVTND